MIGSRPKLDGAIAHTRLDEPEACLLAAFQTTRKPPDFGPAAFYVRAEGTRPSTIAGVPPEGAMVMA